MPDFRSDAERVRALDEAGIPIYRTKEERLMNLTTVADRRRAAYIATYDLAETLRKADPDLKATVRAQLNQRGGVTLDLVVPYRREALLRRAIEANPDRFPAGYRIEKRMQHNGAVYLTFVPFVD